MSQLCLHGLQRTNCKQAWFVSISCSFKKATNSSIVKALQRDGLLCTNNFACFANGYMHLCLRVAIRHDGLSICLGLPQHNCNRRPGKGLKQHCLASTSPDTQTPRPLKPLAGVRAWCCPTPKSLPTKLRHPAQHKTPLVFRTRKLKNLSILGFTNIHMWNTRSQNSGYEFSIRRSP